MTNIILSGANGKMGKVINDCVMQREDIKIACGLDINTTQYSDFIIYKNLDENKQKADVIIDFSHPAMLEGLLDYAIKTKTPLVAATTGYSQSQIEQIKNASKQVPIFFTFNMSIGINLLIDLAVKAMAILGDDFDIEIIEKHHNQKIDAPSGTAIMIANAINSENEYNYEFDRHSKRIKRGKKEIGIHTIRGGTIVGEHEVIFAGRDEIITLTHQAGSKDIFAVSAIKAAVFLKTQKAGLYEMNDLM